MRKHVILLYLIGLTVSPRPRGIIINTGSKQGITNPPGNAAYNASKAAVKSLKESLAHELRQDPNVKLTAHLFV